MYVSSCVPDGRIGLLLGTLVLRGRPGVGGRGGGRRSINQHAMPGGLGNRSCAVTEMCLGRLSTYGLNMHKICLHLHKICVSHC